MAIKLPNLKDFANASAKTRIFIVIAVVVVLSFAIFFVIRYFGAEPTTSGTQVATAPSSLQSVPGAQMTPEFYRAVVQANAQQAQQAQISGTTAVPTLMNAPGQPTGFPQQNCTVLCPSEENVNVADDINDLVKQGKISQEDANRLLNLAKNNASVEEYAASLDELVRQGKITPEQARLMLEKYKKQHTNALANASGQFMDAMIKSGQLPLDVANRLLALQRSNVTPEEYAAELNRLVREGKLSPEAAAKLLAQYTQQRLAEEAKKGAFALQQMAKSGQITPEVANALLALQNKNVSVDEYAAELDRLVKAGKMTPEAAAKLLAQYKLQRGGAGGANAMMNALVDQEQAKATALLGDMVKNKRISQDTANLLNALQQKKVSAEEYKKALDDLVKAGKLSPEDAQKLLASYQKLDATRAEAQRLAALQGNNATLDEYAEELKRAVQAGLISPEMAAQLYAQYRALKTPITPPGGGGPGVETNIPANADFLRLQQAAQAGAAPAAAVEAIDFGTAQQVQSPAQAQAIIDAQLARQQRIEAIQTAMSSQAASLITAWQPPTMVHKEGSPPTVKTSTTTTTSTNAEGGATGKEGGAATPSLIKAGTILFAVLDTTVDSDYPDTPVMATIVQGPLKGAKLLGKLALAQGQDRISLNFTMMDKEEWASAKTISAFAIDPDTARTVMASSVDYHYLKRFGAIMATSFISGYSSAITQAGTSTTGIFGTSTTHPALSSASKLTVGLGQIGTTLGTAVSSYINTPTTVKVNSGVGLGILFMSPVAETEKPQPHGLLQ